MYFDSGEFRGKGNNWIRNSEFLIILEVKVLVDWKNAELEILKGFNN